MREYFWSDGTVQYPDCVGVWAFKLIELGSKRKSYKQISILIMSYTGCMGILLFVV